jgi:N utilization substance protein A
VREVYIDDETREATVIVPDDQLALAIGKEGLNARLATRLTGWKIDIESETEFAKAEAEAAFVGAADDEEYSGRCAAILSNGKRCPNAALPGSRYCGVPAHQALAAVEHDAHEDEALPAGDGAAAAEVVAEGSVAPSGVGSTEPAMSAGAGSAGAGAVDEVAEELELTSEEAE